MNSFFLKSKKKVREIIEIAFANIQFPGDENLLHPACQDSTEIESLKGHNWRYWQDIPGNVIDYHYDSLPFLSPEAFQFFLPAYMTYGLENINSNVLIFTIYSLIAPSNSNDPEMMELFLSWVTQLTPEQKDSIFFFLNYIQQESSQVEDGLNDAGQALEGYWISSFSGLKDNNE